jgi:hypothetical protein
MGCLSDNKPICTAFINYKNLKPMLKKCGINQAGLFFDGAATPDEPAIPGYGKPKGNLGDEILAKCKTVKEAVDYLEQRKVALTNGHLLFGDKTGNAMVVEWVNGQKKLTPVADNKLMITNFLLADTAKGNYPCPRYSALAAGIDQLRQSKDTVGFKQVGSILARAVQPPAKDAKGKEGGTLYSVFTNITDMEFVLVYKLDNAKKIRLNLNKEFAANQQRTIKME